jgi:hypothetical protein
MNRIHLAAIVACVFLSACAADPDSYVAGRADNDMLRFSASNYVMADSGQQ